MATKQSKAELTRLLENGIREVGDIPRDRFYIVVRDVVARGAPPSELIASVLVRFLPSGAPYCCGEPSCYSHAFRDDGATALGDYMRRKLNLRHTVTVQLNVTAEYFNEIRFTAFEGS